jgi:hypothetical protein
LLSRPGPFEGTFVAGWNVGRIYRLSVILGLGVFVVAVAAASRVDLTGLLIVAPCCALLTGRWTRTASVGLPAVGLALVLGELSGEETTVEHVAFTIAVGLVALVNAVSAACLERSAGRAAPHES